MTLKTPTCAGTKKLDLEVMHEIARSHGGVCLSNDYINNKQIYAGGVPKDMNGQLLQGQCVIMVRGVPIVLCSKTKLTIEAMQQIAKTRGGECLSKSYTNGSTKLRWRCQSGHEWMATPDNVKNGESWCPICAR